MSTFATLSVFASLPFNTEVDTAFSASTISELQKKIDLEQTRILLNYELAPASFNAMVDNLQIELTKKLSDAQLKFLRILLNFLRQIDKTYSSENFKNGVYEQALSDFPEIIQHIENENLLGYLLSDPLRSLASLELFKSEACADSFLSFTTEIYPDEVLRTVEKFYEKPYSQAIVVQAAKHAPNSAKRYLASFNKVKSLLLKSKDPAIIGMFDLFSAVGYNSKAYLFLDEILKGQITVSGVVSLVADKQAYYKKLVKMSGQNELTGKYSVQRELSYEAVFHFRKMNKKLYNEGEQAAKKLVATFDSIELLTMLVYARQELLPRSFELLSSELLKKHPQTFDSKTLRCFRKTDFDAFLRTINKMDAKDDLLALFPEEKPDSPKDKILKSNTLIRDEIQPKTKEFLIKDKSKTTAKSDLQKVFQKQYVDGVHTLSKKRVENSFPIFNEKLETANPLPIIENETNFEIEPSVSIEPPKQLHLEVPSQKSISTVVASSISNQNAPNEFAPIKIVGEQKEMKHRKKNTLEILKDMSGIIDKPIAENFLINAAGKYPDDVLKNFYQFQHKIYALKVLEQVAQLAPMSVKKYLPSDEHPLRELLSQSQNEVVQVMFSIHEELGDRTRAYILLEQIVQEKISIKEASEIAQNQKTLFKELVKIASKNEYLGKYSVERELVHYSLKLIREINSKAGESASWQFVSVANLNAVELYYLLVFGQEEVLRTTFNGIFNKIFSERNSTNGWKLMAKAGQSRFRHFVRLCSDFNKMEGFLSSMSKLEWDDLAVRFVSNLESEPDKLLEMVNVGDALGSIENQAVLQILRQTIESEYKRCALAGSAEGTAIYGLLQSLAQNQNRNFDGWISKWVEHKNFPSITKVNQATLFNSHQQNIQQYFFYDDLDGRNSFKHFLEYYNGKSDWNIEEFEYFVKISSVFGNSVEIFANKPEHVESGCAAIEKLFKETGASPSVVVHRGHHHHTEKTLRNLNKAAKIVILGSCGGYHKIKLALEKAPEAHIVSTKYTGTMQINDPMLKMLNEQIRMGNDIVWATFWEQLAAEVGNNPLFYDYIPPHRNTGALFIRAYYQILGV